MTIMAATKTPQGFRMFKWRPERFGVYELFAQWDCAEMPYHVPVS